MIVLRFDVSRSSVVSKKAEPLPTEVPLPLARIVSRCLEKAREARVDRATNVFSGAPPQIGHVKGIRTTAKSTLTYYRPGFLSADHLWKLGRIRTGRAPIVEGHACTPRHPAVEDHRPQRPGTHRAQFFSGQRLHGSAPRDDQREAEPGPVACTPRGCRRTLAPIRPAAGFQRARRLTSD
jgi:hypothetical protein